MSRVDENPEAPVTPQAAVGSGAGIDAIPDIPEGEPFAEEWKAFKREAPRLVNKGKTGKFALLKGADLIGVWDTLAGADAAGRRQFGGAPFLVQEVRLTLRPMRWGYFRPCPA